VTTVIEAVSFVSTSCSLRPCGRTEPSGVSILRSERAIVLVIGAGAAGIAVSKCLGDLNIPNLIVDRHGEAGGSYNRIYPGTQLSSPTHFLKLPGDPRIQSTKYLRASEFASYLTSYAVENAIKPTRREVSDITRDGSEFVVRFSDSEDSQGFRVVVLCTGMFDSPYFPPIPGLTQFSSTGSSTVSFSHASQWRGPSSLGTTRLLIVGGGMTGIELAEECVGAGLRPELSIRSGTKWPLPDRRFGIDPRFVVYPLMNAAPLWMFGRRCSQGWSHRAIDRGFWRYYRRNLLTVRPPIQEAHGDCVVFSDGSSVKVDHIIFATGYRFEMPFLPKTMPRQFQGVPFLSRGQSTLWEGLFCVGVPCAFGASSHFIHGIAEDARAVAERIGTYLGLSQR
jgi:putative flavoprotein involved in K+ transport